MLLPRRPEYEAASGNHNAFLGKGIYAAWMRWVHVSRFCCSIGFSELVSPRISI
jgi:hypothetical protein